MKIDLDRIPPEGLELSQTCNSEDFDLGSSEIKHIDPLNLSGKVTKYGNTANVDVKVKTVFSLRCSRCLEEFTKAIDKDYSFNYPTEGDNRFVDISNDIRQELILGYSVKNLCKDDCKGLCPVCGKNLNQEKCNCQTKPIPKISRESLKKE